MPTPPLPVIANGYLLRQQWLSSGFAHKGLTSFGFVTTETDQQTICETFASAWATHVMPLLSDSMALSDTQILKLDGVSPTNTFTTIEAGTAGGDAHGANAICTPNDCVTVTFRTALAGRSHRGRLYLPPPHYGQLAAAPAPELKSTFISGLSVALNTWMSTVLGATPPLQPVVISRHLAAVTNVTHLTVNEHLTSQRRRMEHVAHR